MAKSKLLHPQFFHKLVHPPPGFHNHLTIPVDFFSKYVEEKIIETNVAELKSDSSDIIWKVKITGRRLSDGWEDFAVANNFQIGDVVLVRYEGDLIFHVSDLGPNFSEIKNMQPLGNNIVDDDDDHDKIGKSLLKKHPHPRTNDCDNEELPVKKKLKKTSDETESDSVSLGNSCFVAIVTTSNLLADTLYLPQHFTSSNSLTRKSRKIVLIDGGGKSWTLDLRVKESSDTFYISQGWRNFCEENGQKAGDLLIFKLVANGETPVLSFRPTESVDNINDCSEACRRESLSSELSIKEKGIERECSEEVCRILESPVGLEKTMNRQIRRPSKPYSSYSPYHKQFVTFTLPPDYVRIARLSLPVPFLRENGINKPGEIYLLGRDGKKLMTSLLLDGKGTMSLGKGWKEFVKANGLESGFTLKLIWEDTTPVLSLCSADSTSDGEQLEHLKSIDKQSLSMDPSNPDKTSKDENNKEKRKPRETEKNHMRTDLGDDEELPRKKKVKKNSHKTEADSSSLNNSCFVATVTALNLREDTLYLPQNFTSSNGLTKECRKIILIDGGVRSWVLDLTFEESSDTFYISGGWKGFCDENGQKAGGLFMFKLVGHGETPVLSFYPTKPVDNRSQRDYFEASGRESLSKELGKEEEDLVGESNVDDCRISEPLMKTEKTFSPKRRALSYSSYSPSHKLFVTFTLPPDYAKISSLSLPALFVKDNGIDKPGVIYLLGKDGKKWLTNLLLDKKGTMSLGKGWKEFVKGNGLESSFKLKLIWEDTTPVLSMCCAESTSDREQEEDLKAIEKQSPFVDPSNGDKIRKDENNNDERSWEREKNHVRRRDSTPSSQKEFVTLTITPYSVKNSTLRLPRKFTRENDINKPGTITLLGKDSIKHRTSLLSDKENRTMFLGNGWKPFVKANGLNTGDSFTLRLIWEDTTPVLSLSCAESTSDREQEECLKATEKQSPFIDPSNGENISKDENTKEERKSWESPVLSFCRAESIDNRSQRDCSEASGRESFSTELGNKEGDIEGESNEDDCRILESLSCAESTSDGEQEEYQHSHFTDSSNGENISKDENNEDERSWERDENHLRCRDSTPSSQKEFVTLTITPYSIKKSTLRLPRKFTRENGINNAGMITLLGKDGIKQLTSLLFDKRTRDMFLGSGWKHFVKENGLNTGDSFTLKLIWEDTTPVLSLYCAESTSDGQQGEDVKATEKRSSFIDPCNKDENNKEEKRSWEREKNHLRRMDSTPSSQNQFVTLTITPYSVEKCILRLPRSFTRENHINNRGMIALLGKDGKKQQTRLLYDKRNRATFLGSGWKHFVKANGLNTGDSFTLKLIWEDTTPMLSLCCEKTSSYRGQEEFPKAIEKQFVSIDSSSGDEISKEENNYEEIMSMERDTSHLRQRDSTPSSEKQFVTFILTPYSVEKCIQHLPREFTTHNGINKPGMITLLGKDGIKQETRLLSNKGTMALGSGWKNFVKANGLKPGDSIVFKLLWEDTTPVLSLCTAEFSTDSREEGCSGINQNKSRPDEPNSCEYHSEDENIIEENNTEDKRKEGSSLCGREKNHLRCMDSTPLSQNRFLTITATPNSHKRIRLPRQFLKENRINKPGLIYLLGKDGKKWTSNLVQEIDGRMNLGSGWKVFAEANGLKSGESFTLESIWEDATPMLRLSRSKSTSTEEDTSSAIGIRFVTLTLTPEDVKACKLHLPSRYMVANGINKIGKITILGENGMEWYAYLLSRDGFVALGNGWDEFCEANGVKLGMSFTLEFISEQDNITPSFKLCSLKT